MILKHFDNLEQEGVMRLEKKMIKCARSKYSYHFTWIVQLLQLFTEKCKGKTFVDNCVFNNLSKTLKVYVHAISLLTNYYGIPLNKQTKFINIFFYGLNSL